MREYRQCAVYIDAVMPVNYLVNLGMSENGAVYKVSNEILSKNL